ncbi:MAG: hypothetical protein JXR83_11750 [Deltaproteobacteria bacterium]|nr:hypothetical protein [Deltaproteobacteria bacterium]
MSCQNDGTAVVVVICRPDQVCIGSTCQDNVVCTPGERHCIDAAVYVCTPDGTDYQRIDCGAGSDCIDGECVPIARWCANPRAGSAGATSPTPATPSARS